MMPCRRRFLAVLALLAAFPAAAPAESAAELERAADQALATLKASEPETDRMIRNARGILIFPEIVKGGFLVGAAAGKGVLRVRGRTEGYFRSVAASFGLQAGISKFGYAMFLMDDAAVDFVRKTQGWEIGTGPNIIIADKGFATKLSSSSLQEGIYVFFFSQEGFFAGAGLEGSKIERIVE